VVLVLSGLWNVSATHEGQPTAWAAALGAGIAIFVPPVVAALVVGVFLAG
jgi:hypothetical protein